MGTGMVKEYKAGEIIIVTQADPAVATNYSAYSLPSGYVYKLIGLSLEYQNDANTTNRYVTAEIAVIGMTDPIQVIAPYPINQAGRLWYLSGAVGGQQAQISQGLWSGQFFSLPDIDLPAGSTIRPVCVVGMQAGDQLSNLSYVIKRWGV